MSITPEDIKRIAQLARLHFEKSELERLTSDLNAILGHVDSLRDLEEDHESEASLRQTSKIAPTTLEQISGPDKLREMPEKFAPQWLEGFFLVPLPPGVKPSGDK